MAKPFLICPVGGKTPVESGVSRSSLRTLPSDLLAEASRRLGVMSLLGAVLWVSATALYHVAILEVYLGDPNWHRLELTDAVATVSALLSLALFFYTRRSTQSAKFILDLGLVYLVVTSLGIGLVFHMDPVPTHKPLITWIGPVMLMFAAIVPNKPYKILAACLISASMNPLGMLIAKARGTWDFGPMRNVLLMHYPDYLLVGVAVVISIVMTKLGHQVATAREMGSYRLVNMLGKGGMGEVWRASHRMLARDAAIKLIQPEMLHGSSGKDAAVVRRRFEQEAKATAALRSPHTVHLYDFGVTEDGVYYYVMELLDGIDLETLVKRFGPLPPARAAYILQQICRSLADAHSRGMIHRDIKPTNILLCRMGTEYDFVKVLDFGLVKMPDNGNPQMTGIGATTGTPAYMAPELAMGRSDIDGRTDLYGLGCVAYWLIAGKLVFEENGATAMMLAHLSKTPIRLSERSELAVPASLDRAIMMCLAKDPAERPASAEVLGRLLESSRDAGSWTSDDAEGWWREKAPEGTFEIVQTPDSAQAARSAFTTW